MTFIIWYLVIGLVLSLWLEERIINIMLHANRKEYTVHPRWFIEQGKRRVLFTMMVLITPTAAVITLAKKLFSLFVKSLKWLISLVVK